MKDSTECRWIWSADLKAVCKSLWATEGSLASTLEVVLSIAWHLRTMDVMAQIPIAICDGQSGLRSTQEINTTYPGQASKENSHVLSRVSAEAAMNMSALWG